MCLLTLISPNADVNYDHLENGAKANPHGFGWALVYTGDDERRHLLTAKTMNRAEALDGLKTARDEHPDSWALFHSRWSTGGVKTAENSHPYLVKQNGRDYDPQTVLAHNGVLFSVPRGETRSDTRIFAEDMFPSYRRLDRAGVQNQLLKTLNANKIVVLTANPRYLNPAYIFNQERGDWVQGVWHSNGDWKGRKTFTGKTTVVSAKGAKTKARDDYLDDLEWSGYGAYLLGDPPAGSRVIRETGTGWSEYVSPVTGSSYRWRDNALTERDCGVCGAFGSVDMATALCQYCEYCRDCQEHHLDCVCRQHGDEPERLALPAGSGSSTKYGDAGDDDAATAAYEARIAGTSLVPQARFIPAGEK